MGNTAVIYGLDIETDTTGDGWDPAVASVRTIALSCRSLDEVFTGHEATLLADLDRRLATLPRGIIATWNGATFDLPFIADRARLLGVDLGLRLCLDHRLTLGRPPLPGHAGAYRGAWGHHAHVDTFRLYGQGSPSPTWTSLRTVGRLLGLGGAAGPTDRTHDLVNEVLHAHAASDARLARVLAERRLGAALRCVDRLAPEDAQVVTVAARRLERLARQERALHPSVATI